MADDPVLALERELVRAAARQAAAPVDLVAARHRRRRVGVAATVALAAIPALAVIAAVVVVLAGRGGETPAVPAGPTLTQTLGVLRRAQTGFDLRPVLVDTARDTAVHRHMTVDRGLIRRVQVTLAGPGREAIRSSVGLFVLRTTGSDPELRLSVWSYPTTFRVRAPPGFIAQRLVSDSPSAGVTAQQLRAHGILDVIGDDGATDTDVVAVVPDGVRTVRLLVPGMAPLTAPVHENVAGFRVPSTNENLIEHRGQIVWFGPGHRTTARHIASRLTNGLCGAGTARICPGPGVDAGGLTRLLGVVRRPPRSGEVPTRVELNALTTSAQLYAARVEAQLLRSVSVRLRPGPSRITVDLVAMRAGRRELLSVGTYPPGGFTPDTAGRLVYFGPPITPAALAARGDTAQVMANVRTGSQVIVVVPDGVARVVLRAPGERPISSSVSDNVAGFLVPGKRFAVFGKGARITWLARNGRVLAQIPDA